MNSQVLRSKGKSSGKEKWGIVTHCLVLCYIEERYRFSTA